jgi:hypothetical protein
MNEDEMENFIYFPVTIIPVNLPFKLQNCRTAELQNFHFVKKS